MDDTNIMNWIVCFSWAMAGWFFRMTWEKAKSRKSLDKKNGNRIFNWKK